MLNAPNNVMFNLFVLFNFSSCLKRKVNGPSLLQPNLNVRFKTVTKAQVILEMNYIILHYFMVHFYNMLVF